MRDPIERQDAIDAMACAIWHYPNLSFLSDYGHAHELAEDALKRLPSAGPGHIRCGLTGIVGDYLVRIQDVIAITEETGALETQRRVKELKPFVQPERKTGKWYKPTGMMPPEFSSMYRCSECDGLAMCDWKHHQQVLSDYCPRCGADMRGEKDNGIN